MPIIKCPAVAFDLRSKAPKSLGFANKIIETAGHFISWISRIEGKVQFMESSDT
ncbi:MAG: hypothetical protein KME50_35945 [Nostoc desertorum CM1-VF14]|nr:hypothetical protein [Nostoc desertorum CM1-VF14]